VNGDINGDRNAFNDLAPNTTWNQYRLPYQSSLDPRIARRFEIGESRHLLVIWEAYNLWTRPNYTAVDNTLYWVNAGALVSRMNFAVDLSKNAIRGVRVPLSEEQTVALKIGAPEFQRQ
jgi:hypothetical protein